MVAEQADAAPDARPDHATRAGYAGDGHRRADARGAPGSACGDRARGVAPPATAEAAGQVMGARPKAARLMPSFVERCFKATGKVERAAADEREPGEEANLDLQLVAAFHG